MAEAGAVVSFAADGELAAVTVDERVYLILWDLAALRQQMKALGM